MHRKIRNTYIHSIYKLINVEKEKDEGKSESERRKDEK